MRYAVSQVKVDQGLIGYTRFLRHVLEVANDVVAHPDNP